MFKTSTAFFENMRNDTALAFNYFSKSFYFPEDNNESFDYNYVFNVMIDREINNHQNNNLIFFCRRDYTFVKENLSINKLNDIETKNILNGIMILIDCYNEDAFYTKTGIIYKNIKGHELKQYSFRLFLHILSFCLISNEIKINDNKKEKLTKTKMSLMKKLIFKSNAIYEYLLDHYDQKNKSDNESTLNNNKKQKKINAEDLLNILNSTKKPKKKKKKLISSNKELIYFFECCQAYATIQINLMFYELQLYNQDKYEYGANINNYKKHATIKLLKETVVTNNEPVMVIVQNLIRANDTTVKFLEEINKDVDIRKSISQNELNSIALYSSTLNNCLQSPLWNQVRENSFLINNLNKLTTNTTKLAIQNVSGDPFAQIKYSQNNDNVSIDKIEEEEQEKQLVIEEDIKETKFDNKLVPANENKMNLFDEINDLNIDTLNHNKNIIEAVGKLTSFNLAPPHEETLEKLGEATESPKDVQLLGFYVDVLKKSMKKKSSENKDIFKKK